MPKEKNAYNDLIGFLHLNERVELLVFGKWCAEKNAAVVKMPKSKIGKIMLLEEAKKYMIGWSFYADKEEGDFFACYPVTVWTTQRVIWVTLFEGSTWLDSIQRNPVSYVPDLYT